MTELSVRMSSSAEEAEGEAEEVLCIAIAARIAALPGAASATRWS